MRTPWGRLRDLDLNDHGIAEKIIFADKHQLVEGLVAECLFDQIAQKMKSTSDSHVLPLDVETIIVDTNRASERWLAFVWARSKTAGLGRYLLALERGFVPYLLEYDPMAGFSAIKRENGRSVSAAEPLTSLMVRLSDGAYQPFTVSASVRDEMRQKQAFWGYISSYYGARIGYEIVLPRLLINCGIQPYFRRVDDQVWLLEVKHKFPKELPAKGNWPTLRFGINDGELALIDRLAEFGIRCLHTILVKPYWSKEIGSTYLLSDLSLRERAAMIAIDLNRNVIKAMMAGRAGKSGAHTTIDGRSSMNFRMLSACSFRDMGVLSDRPEDLAREMIRLMRDEPGPQVREEHLQALRCPA
jgi:hypothetical protein